MLLYIVFCFICVLHQDTRYNLFVFCSTFQTFVIQLASLFRICSEARCYSGCSLQITNYSTQTNCISYLL